MTAIYARISGVAKPAKRRQPAQQWQVENRDLVHEEVQRQFAEERSQGSTASKVSGAFRQKVVRDMFAKLDATEQKRYADRALAEAETAKHSWEAAVNGPPSTDPAVRAK